MNRHWQWQLIDAEAGASLISDTGRPFLTNRPTTLTHNSIKLRLLFHTHRDAPTLTSPRHQHLHQSPLEAFPQLQSIYVHLHSPLPKATDNVLHPPTSNQPTLHLTLTYLDAIHTEEDSSTSAFTGIYPCVRARPQAFAQGPVRVCGCRSPYMRARHHAFAQGPVRACGGRCKISYISSITHERKG